MVLNHQKMNMKRKLLLLLGFVFLASFSLFAQGRQVKGKVLDDKGAPLLLATILVLNESMTKGVTTDINGEFSIMLEQGENKLKVTFSGMEDKIIEVGDQTYLEISLMPLMLEVVEIVDIDYGLGTVSQVRNTGGVASVDKRAFEMVPIASFDQMIQGRAAGVLATTGSGQPGATARVLVRGVGSISAGTSPLYVIDGVTSRAEDFTQLNPNDIETFTVLKDAASAAIYGSRAGNGVIVITTRRGKEGKTRFDYSYFLGQSERTRDKFQMMNAEQKIEYERNFRRRSIPLFVEDSLLANNTNWANAFFRKGKTLTHNFSATGGTEKAAFFISGQYYKEDGILPKSDLERYSSRINFDYKISSKTKISTSITANYSRRNFIIGEAGTYVGNPVLASYIANPYESVYIRDREGNIIPGPDGRPQYNRPLIAIVRLNPLEETELNSRVRDDFKTLGSLRFEHEITKGLKFTAQGGMDLKYFEFTDYRDKRSYIGNTVSPAGQIFRQADFYNQFNGFSTLQYSKTIKQNHSFDVLAGMEALRAVRYNMAATQVGTSNPRIRGLSGASTPRPGSGNYIQDNGLVGYFITGKYSFKDKYIFDAMVRRDVSSRFGPNRRGANFWSVSAAWNVMEEKFMEKIDKRYIGFLKTRVSYGTLGNQEFDDFGYLGLYGFTNSFAYVGAAGSGYIQVPAPNLGWEKGSIFNFGFDIGLFKKRIEITTEIYRRNTTDLLFDAPISATSGLQEQASNVAALRNNGLEFSIKTTNIDVRRLKLKWTTNFNINFNQNRVLKISGDTNQIISGITILKIGSPINSLFLPRYAGVNPGNGEPLFYDSKGGLISGNRISDDNQVASVLGTTDHTRWGGFDNIISFYGFDLSVYFIFVGGNELLNRVRYFTENPDFGLISNQEVSQLRSWQNPGDITDQPRVVLPGRNSSESPGESRLSSRQVEDGSFVRLRNVQFGYTVPEKHLKRLKIRYFRAYFQAQNLATYTKYTGFDPETRTGDDVFNYPVPRTLGFGFNVGF
jgi:TonB-linked SusC/RagA family outer membrane protein